MTVEVLHEEISVVVVGIGFVRVDVGEIGRMLDVGLDGTAALSTVVDLDIDCGSGTVGDHRIVGCDILRS
jgi:hypothetical protein